MKRSKSCDQSLRDEDRISQLPEALLLQILSLLPTGNAVATSVLSKQWKSLWKMLPNLKFTYYGYGTPDNDLEIFSDNVYRCLLSHQAPVLQSLHLDVSFDEGHAMDLGRLVGIAFRLHVRNVVLESFCSRGSFRFPRSLFNGETLETLEFRAFCGTIIVDVPSPVCLKSLRTLQLYQVVYKDDESVLNLLSGCINLENLVVNRKGFDNVKTFTIVVPSLQRLTLIDESYNLVYEVNAPSLKYLKIKGRFGRCRYCLIENAPEVVEANIDIDIDDAIYENILGSLTSVKRLSLKLSPLEITFPAGSTYYQLVYLELSIYRASDWCNLLTLMLDISPNLQVLELIGFNMVSSGKWNQPKNVPECLLLHLETFVWTHCGAILENEREVVKYILRNARRLKKATFSSRSRISLEKSVEMVEELKSVVRASNSYIIFNSKKRCGSHECLFQTTVPNLEFIYDATYDLERFLDNISRCLLSHQAPVLQSLHLEMNIFGSDFSMDIGILMGIAFGGRPTAPVGTRSLLWEVVQISYKYKALDESCLIENVPELVEAKIINVSKIFDEKLLESLTSVKRLSLSLSPMKIKPMNGIFNQLVYLELYTNKKVWWNLLSLMLDSSPKLQVLKLIDHNCWKIDLVARGEWKQPKNVPECLLLHLETFMWKGYDWEQKEEREVAKYILKNSNHLKRATFSTKYICSQDRLVVIEELKRLVKDTNSCQFQFKWNL